MPRKFFGDPNRKGQQEDPEAAGRVLKNNQELAAEIAKIKETDPKGWAQAELKAAREIVIDALVQKDIPKAMGYQETLPLQRALDKRYRHMAQQMKTFDALQILAEQNGIVIEFDDFEPLAYEIYMNP